MQDLNAADVDAAMRMIAGTARSMGVEVIDQWEEISVKTTRRDFNAKKR